MKQQIPSYIIKYIECGHEGHQGEKVNLICLNSECHEHSLICSLCTPKHRGHSYKPIKIYLDELYHKFQAGASEQHQDIDQLQKRKLLLLHNLKVCVEKISQSFMKLEEDILFTYEKIRNQIHQNETRKSKFAQFYLSMVKENYGDPHFQVKNYLFKEEIKILTDQDIFENLVKEVEREITSVRLHFISESHPIEVPASGSKQKEEVVSTEEFLLPKNIIREANLYSQTNLAINSPNLCLMNLQIGQWTGKMRLVLSTFKAGAKLTVGLMTIEDFKNANHVYKDTLNCSYIDSAGKSKGVQYNHIGAFAVTTSIDFFVKKNNFRIVSKNNVSIINLAHKNYYFFFAMEGTTKVQITYPYVK